MCVDTTWMNECRAMLSNTSGLAEQQGYPISFNTFFKTGFPIMVFSVSVATVYMLVFHVLIPWY